MKNNVLKWIVYTDGACSGNPGPGGWAAIACSVADSRVIEGGGFDTQTTNNRMEISATLKSLQLIAERESSGKNSQPEGAEIFLYTDSVYVIRGITEWIWGWKKRNWVTGEGAPVSNKDLWIELEKAVKVLTTLGLSIEWKYVRGHTGVDGNERCDEIAVAYSKRDDVYLYDGDVKGYRFEILKLPPDQPVPENKKFGKSTESKTPAFYLSYINGNLQRHETWSSCEAVVKGRPGAKFKKISSPAEEADTKKKWGLS